MNRLEKIEYIKKEVSQYIDKELNESLSKDDLEHLKSIGGSIIADYHDILPGGGFVRAFNDNKLEQTFNYADRIIRNHILLLIKMKTNINLFEL